MKIKSINPADNVLLETFDSATKMEVDHAVDGARKAFRQWSVMPLAERQVYFDRLSTVIQNRTSEILGVIKTETGKLLPDGEAEVYDVIDAISYYLVTMRNLKSDENIPLNATAFPDTDLAIGYVPYGVIGLIMPWNFPFYSPMMFIIASLVAGNAVVFKPSECATLVGLTIGRLFVEAGFPVDLLQVIIGADETGRFVTESNLDKIFFVGSVEGGKDVIVHADLKPVQVELGGNSAALVLRDADLDLAAQGIAWGGTYHSGQDCAGVKRVFVVRSVADAFLAKLTAIVEPLRAGIDYGPYITAEAMHCVKERISNAEKGGAQVLCGGEIIDSPGNWLKPSVIRYEDSQLPLVALETFGNTIPVKVVDSVEEAIAEANNTIYGLSSSVFTRDMDGVKAIAASLECGMVFVNDPFVAIPGWDHWTGWRRSGFGTVESKLMQCLKKKLLSVNKSGIRRTFWYPYPDRAS